MSFARYAAIVKNLRGVVVGYLEEEGCEESIQWLASRFRYRDLGVGPRFLRRYGSRVARYLGGKPLREIVFPVAELELFVERLGRELGLDDVVAEGLVLASTYVSPLLAIGKRVEAVIEPLAVDKVLADVKSMKVQDWKLHLRIADYTILDFYEQCVVEAMELIRRSFKEVDKVLRDRVERIRKDVKRYWRILKESGEPYLLYIDMLRISRSVLEKDGFGEDVAAALAIVPVVCIPPHMR